MLFCIIMCLPFMSLTAARCECFDAVVIVHLCIDARVHVRPSRSNADDLCSIRVGACGWEYDELNATRI
jgi:hypothetical protein